MRRSRFNYITNTLLTTVIILTIQTFLSMLSSYRDYPPNQHEALSKIFGLIFIGMIGIGIQVYLARGRLRDMDKNPDLAWLVIIPFVWFYFAIAPGTEGENQYGASPKQLIAEKEVKEDEHQALTHPTEIDIVLQKIEINVSPLINKVESINFQLNELDERLFYGISPENVKKLRKRLEVLADRLQDNDTSYGYKYAVRNFYIGDKIIFSWQKEIKL